MRLRQSPVAVLLLVPAGVLAGHAAGYAAAGHVHGGPAGTAGHPHGYLAAAGAAAAFLAIVVLAGTAAGVGRTTRRVPFGRVVAVQCGALLLQEAVEHALAGGHALTLLTSLALWLSLAGQVVAAAGAALLLRSTRVVGTRLASLPGRIRPVVLPVGSLVPLAANRAIGAPVVRLLAARGPPCASA